MIKFLTSIIHNVLKNVLATKGQSLQEYIDQLKNYPDRGDDS